MPLLAEELADITIDELIHDFGAELVAQEHWYGLEFSLRVNGVCLYAAPADTFQEEFDF